MAKTSHAKTKCVISIPSWKQKESISSSIANWFDEMALPLHRKREQQMVLQVIIGQKQ
jgi:hypothetical protein